MNDPRFVYRAGNRLARFIPAFVAAVCCLLSVSCITLAPRSRRPSSSAIVIQDVPQLTWGIESCGAGSLATVLQHYGEPTTMQTWDATLPKMRGGVLTIDMLLAARGKGFDATLVTGDRALIENELRSGHPVILMLRVIDTFGRQFDFFHYIVVDGLDADRGLIRTQFGDAKARWTTFDRLEKAWSGGGHAAILIHPGDPATPFIRAAVALEERGDVAGAAAEYRKLLAQHPGSALAWTNLGNVEMKLGHREESEDAFRHALKLDAGSRDALNNLAWLLLEEKRLPEAETLARAAVAQKGPDTWVVLDTLARVLAAKGDCGEAAKTMEEARTTMPPQTEPAPISCADTITR